MCSQLQLTKRASLKGLKCISSEALLASFAESTGLSFLGKEDKKKGLEFVRGTRMLPNPSGFPDSLLCPGDASSAHVVTRLRYLSQSISLWPLIVCTCMQVCVYTMGLPQ